MQATMQNNVVEAESNATSQASNNVRIESLPLASTLRKKNVKEDSNGIKLAEFFFGGGHNSTPPRHHLCRAQGCRPERVPKLAGTIAPKKARRCDENIYMACKTTRCRLLPACSSCRARWPAPGSSPAQTAACSRPPCRSRAPAQGATQGSQEKEPGELDAQIATAWP
eukprot:scaffold15463_cov37-Prasinocladus_malaysianus.AAC.1